MHIRRSRGPLNTWRCTVAPNAFVTFAITCIVFVTLHQIALPSWRCTTNQIALHSWCWTNLHSNRDICINLHCIRDDAVTLEVRQWRITSQCCRLDARIKWIHNAWYSYIFLILKLEPNTLHYLGIHDPRGIHSTHEAQAKHPTFTQAQLIHSTQPRQSSHIHSSVLASWKRKDCRLAVCYCFFSSLPRWSEFCSHDLNTVSRENTWSGNDGTRWNQTLHRQDFSPSSMLAVYHSGNEYKHAYTQSRMHTWLDAYNVPGF